MPNLRTWIEAQLKRGYAKQQIKKVLIGKGYSPEAVAEVDKISYSAESQSKKITKNFSYKSFISIIIVIGVLVWLFNAPSFFQKQPSQNIVTGQKAAGQIGDEKKETGEVLPAVSQLGPKSVEELCSGFRETPYNLSCNEAVALALADSPGEAQKVLIGTMQIPDFSTGSLTFIEKNAWLIDIKLESPYFDKDLGKEIKILRIGLGLNGGIGINRRLLE